MLPIPIAKLLVVDDEAAHVKALVNTLETEGYSAVGFTSARMALAALGEEAFDLLLTDLMMPEMDGVAFLRAALEIDPALVGIVMTGHGALETAVQAMQAGALDYILKPFRLNAILPVLARSLGVRRLRMENIELHQAVGMYELSRMIGLASDFDTVLQSVADAAAAQSRVRGVFVLVPSGTDGNELEVAAARGESADGAQGTRIPLSDELAQWLVQTRERLSLSEPAGIQLLNAPLSGIPGNVSVAMLAGGNFKGILRFVFEYPQRPIAPGQIKALNILASEAAAALDAASLLNQVQAGERQYRRLAENAADVIFRCDLHPVARLTYINDAVTAITGYSPKEYYANPGLALKIIHPDDRALMETVLRGGRPNGDTTGLRCMHRNGNTVWIEQRTIHVRDEEGHLVAIEAIARDVSERKQAEERFHLVVEAAPSAMVMVGADGRIALINSQTEKLFGYERRELLGEAVERLVPERFRSGHGAHRKGFFSAPTARTIGVGRDLFGVRKDGSEVPVEIGLSPISSPEGNFVLASIIDITERKIFENNLKRALNEKLALLQEVHHRVKNNLNIISSLLSLQANSMEDEKAVAKLLDSQRRIISMAMIHEQLYQHDDMSSIDLAEYVRELTAQLFSSYSASKLITYRLEVAPTILTIEQSIPCGLILNELITNALKYAYPDGEGEILVLLRAKGDYVSITVSDRGVGVPPGFDLKTSKSFGMTIIEGLTAQLDGELEIGPSPGVSFTVSFPKSPLGNGGASLRSPNPAA